MNLDDTKDYKKIGLSNYNDLILDLYDANPIANLGADYPKKLKLPESSAGKSEKPKSTTLVKETLRLRNTALLNVKLKQKIFKWEKERFSQLKPYLPPDGTGEGSRTVINLNDEDDLGGKFKIPRFPKIPLPSLKFKPRIVLKPAPVLQGQPAEVQEKTPAEVPVSARERLKRQRERDRELSRQRQRERERQPSFPRVVPPSPRIIPPLLIPAILETLRQLITPEAISAESGTEVEITAGGDGDSITQDGSTRGTNRSRGGRRLPEQQMGGDGVKGTGSNSTSTATVERPGGTGGGGSGGNKTKIFSTTTGNQGKIFFDGVNDPEFNRIFLNQSPEELGESLKQLRRMRKRNNPLSKPTAQEKLFEDAIKLKKIMGRVLNSGVISRKNDLSWMTEKPGKPRKTIQKKLPGTNPNTTPRISSSPTSPNSPLDLLLNQSLAAAANDMNAMKALPGTNLNARKPLSRLNSPKVRAAGFAALDVGFTALDFAQRKGSGQTNLQAGVGAGGGLVGGMVAQGVTGVTAAALTKLAAASAITPIPGARPLALLLLLGAGMMGSMAGGDLADSLTGVNAGQEPKVKRNRRGRIIKSKPTPTQAPTAVEELPINSSEELDDEMIKEAFLSGALLNSGGTGMIQYVPVPFEVPVTVKVPVIPSSHWGYTLNGG